MMDQDCRNRIISEDYADFMLKYGETLDTIKERLDVCIDSLNYDTAVVYTPISNLPRNFIHLYGYGAYPNCYGLLDIASLDASGIAKVRTIPSLDLQGRGVLIGVVDTGIEYTHEAFKNADNTSKILSIWDQTIVSDASMPEGFHFGTEYTQAQINEALQSEDPLSIVPSMDANGHGTYLAGIAAAMLLEWGIVRRNYIQISTVEIKQLFIRGAKQDENLTYPNKDWGYGMLDLYNAYNSLRGELE